jgi:hypothetical protein
MIKRPQQHEANEDMEREEGSHVAKDVSEGASAPDFTLPHTRNFAKSMA